MTSPRFCRRSGLRTPFTVLVAALVGLTLWSGLAGAEENVPADAPTLASIAPSVRAAIKDKDAGRALDLLRPCADVKALDLVADALDLARKQRQDVEKKQVSLEADYEKLIDEGHELQRDLEMSQRSARDVENFNKKARKIDFARQRTLEQLRSFETEFARLRGIEQLAAGVAAEILGRLDEAGMEAGVQRLEKEWLSSKDEDERLRYVHAIWELPAPLVMRRLHALLDDPEQKHSVRATAMGALAARGDEGLFGKAVTYLALPPESFGLTTAAIHALRRMHRKEAIEPLMDFLAREDLGRLREDAHLALLSLTGQKHGPYAEPWKTWWQDAKATFEMPKEPTEPGRVEGQQKGVTFYDIHTFSDRVLFIVDISGSMDKVDGDAKGRTKWEVAREQLVGAVHGLDKDAVFNVVFFNHSVVRWQRKVQAATEPTKDQLEKWVNATNVVGGTNIHDALEAGFGVAQQATGRPIIDTIFFLTDGRPTAGKIQDGKAILDQVREWNAVAQLRIHAIGIGAEHDVDFMKELARIGDGEYVAR
ncbi:MAG: VWA domain-containing protein [Planctomycetes bacterium]|nr:VWA domain-containing protein [Planctomycetota bacterium]